MFLSLIETRRSIRKYLRTRVESTKIDRLIEAALRSPSSKGSNPWAFIVVTEQEKLEKLSQAKPHGATFLKNAPLAIVVCANPDESDVWIEDASIASTFVMLAAESMDLGSCWIQIRNRMHDDMKTAGEYVAEILSLPEKLRVESIIAIGHPDEKKEPLRREGLQYEKAFLNVYGELYDNRAAGKEGGSSEP